jgi:serine/threonine-protein kinase
MAAEQRRAGDQALPRRIGRYDAFLQIGAGGMARVYLAVQQGQQAQLAVVKILRPEAVEDEHVLALFMDEARISMRLQHPNVIRTREVVAEPPNYMLAMDFVNGQSLLQVLRRIERQAVPVDEHIYILSKVLAGLSYAHELKDTNGQPFGIVHRDVSPANVLVSYTGEVKLLDFGIAKATGALAATQDGVVKGKLGYAAPEQCLGKPADPRSDIYAVGVMLWEAIAGRRRATGETWHSVLQARLEDAEPQLEEVCPDAPKALAAIARKALAREPEDRYATARDFQRDLERYLGEKQRTKVVPARIAAMLKPHFDQDQKDQQRAIEAFLATLRSGGSGARRRLPLPGAAASGAAAPATPAPAAGPASPKAPVVEEEQTSRIPVDAALLIMSRAEAAAASDGKSSRTTAPPPPSQGTIPTAPPPAAQKPPPPLPSNAPPPAAQKAPKSSPVTAPAPSQNPVALAAPSSQSSPPSNDVTAPEPAVPTVAPSSSPRASFPRPSDAYGVVTLPKADAGSHPLASVADVAPPRKKTRAWPAVLVLGGAVALAAGIVSLRKSSNHAAAAAQATAAAEQARATSAPPTAPKVDTVKVRISVDPADAVVKLDGRVLASNPFVMALPRDNDAHELTAYAEGCRDLRQAVHLNQDVDLLVALKRLKGFVRSTPARAAAVGAAARAAAAVSAPVLAAQPTAEPHPEAPAPAAEPGVDLKGLPPSEPAPKRPSDEENPYGQ